MAWQNLAPTATKHNSHLGLHHPLCQLGKEFCGTAPVSNRADGADAGAHGHDVGVTALEKRSVLGVLQQVFKHHTGVVDSSSAKLGTPYLQHYTYSIDFKFGLHTKNKLELTVNITYSYSEIQSNFKQLNSLNSYIQYLQLQERLRELSAANDLAVILVDPHGLGDGVWC